MNGTTKIILAMLLAAGSLPVFAANGGYENGNAVSMTIDGVEYAGYGDSVTVSARPTAGEALTMKYAQCKALASVDLSDVGAIGDAAFAYSAVESLVLSGNITSLGYISFGGCTNLVSVQVDSWGWARGTENIQDKAPFSGCANLTTLVVKGEASAPPEDIDVSGIFENLTTIVCPEWQMAAWRSAYTGVSVVCDDTVSACEAYLRIHSFYGYTSGTGDEGEWFMLTNTSESVDLDVSDVTLVFAADGEDEENAGCRYTIPSGMFVTGSSYMRDSSRMFNIKEVFGGKAPVIPNGNVRIFLRDADGRLCQALSVDPAAFASAAGGGDHLVCTTVEKEAYGSEYWKAESSGGGIYLAAGGYSSPFVAADQASADAFVASRVNIVLSSEDALSGLKSEHMKAFAVAVPGQVGVYQAYVGVNPDTVPAPEIGENGSSPAMKVSVSSDGATVEIAIGNAVPGLWYGCQTKNDLSSDFVNDLPSFTRAAEKGPLVLRCSSSASAAAFFRVVVMVAQPLE